MIPTMIKVLVIGQFVAVYEGLDDEINPYESHRVYMETRDEQQVGDAGSSATHPPPRLSTAPTLNTILIQNLKIC
jgi:hypothetical protein